MTKPNQQPPSPDKGISRPDADRAAEGQATFDAPDPDTTHARDRAHGFSQDSGYASSGGKPKEAPTQKSSHSPSSAADSTSATDEQIRQRVHERLTQNAILQGDQVTISVQDGIVTLQGEVRNEIQRGELKELLGSIPSVKELRSELRLVRN